MNRVLQGAKADDLPIELPTTFTLAVNLRTAKSLGLTIPPTLLARAPDCCATRSHCEPALACCQTGL
ncbi:MAG: hypothetical protein K0R61_1814 [Microvirga sp.]|nr:hypothetical protein [Microvirga sp.]